MLGSRRCPVTSFKLYLTKLTKIPEGHLDSVLDFLDFCVLTCTLSLLGCDPETSFQLLWYHECNGLCVCSLTLLI